VSYAFELYLDERSEEALRTVWRALDGAGLLSPELKDDARPHVSLCVTDDIDLDVARRTIDHLCIGYNRLKLQLGVLGTFVTEQNVIFVAPTMTDELRRIHLELNELLHAKGAVVWDYYLPNRWLPHCTLATAVPESRYMEAFAAIRRAFVPLVATVESLGLVSFLPVKLLHVRPLRLPGA